MATPRRDPRKERLYLRRQIPVKLRPAFGGSRFLPFNERVAKHGDVRIKGLAGHA